MALESDRGAMGGRAAPTRIARPALLRALLLAAAAAAGLLLLLRPVKTPLNYYDEGLVLLNATNVLQGDIPYRDFWSLYSPGNYYLLAGVFRVFGVSILAARLFDVALRALLALAVFGLARRFVSAVWALVPAGLAVLWLSATGFFSYPVFPALLASLAACLGLCRYLGEGGARRLLASGVAVGLAAAIRHDLGLYVALGVGLGLLAHAWAGRRPLPLRSLLLLGAGAAAVAGPFYLYLALAGDARAMWEDLIAFPVTGFHAYRDLPKPPLVPDLKGEPVEALTEWLRFYTPLSIYAAALATALALAVRQRRRPAAGGEGYVGALAALTATGLLTFNQALGRYEALHVLPSQLYALLVLVALLARLPRAPRIGLVALLLVALAPVYLLRYGVAYLGVAQNDPLRSYSSLPRSSGVPLPPGAEAAVGYIRQHTRPDEPIFVGNTHHDLIVVNDLGFYFLADRRSPSPYQELHPGVATTLPVQQRIVRRLEEAGVRYIVEVVVWEPREPNRSAVSSGVTYLDEWIGQHFTPCFRAGNYRVLRREP